MKVSAQYAATHFNDIVSAATDGEEVEIAVPDKPTLKLVVANPHPQSSPTGRRDLGAGSGLVQEEAAWIAANRAQFVGRWVALVGGNLLAVGDSASEVFQATAQLVPTPLIMRLEAEVLPFSGW